MGWVSSMLEASRQMTPHGYCLLWQPELVWIHVLSDAVIAVAYFSIPIALLYFIRKRPDFEFGWVIWLFALFIVACGTTHAMSIWTLWHADYVAEGLVKGVTAAASIGTAAVLWPVIPKLLALQSPKQVAAQRDQLANTLVELTRETAERKKAEDALRQAQKMEAVGQLTGGIAHDFNNLLQTVTGAVDMIARQPQGPKIEKWASLALQAAERGSKLTGQLLAFSRTQKLQLRPMTVAPLVEEVRELLQSAVGPTIKLEYMLAGPELVHICGDPTQIELALLNLAVNARDAMPNGGTVTVSTRRLTLSGDRELVDGDYLELSVADQGKGMAEEVRARAFEPFFTTKGGHGSGLGLAMVYGIAKQSGGRAEIESHVGEGTRVSMLFKVVDETGVEVSEQTQSTPAVTASALTLVVDDDETVRVVTVGMLEEMGHRVVEAGSGEAALELLRSLNPDLLIFDYAMPEMTGAELAAQVRRAGNSAPIIFATGYSDTVAIEAEVGTEAVLLQKPFSSSDLMRAVGKCLAAGAIPEPSAKAEPSNR